MERPIHDHGILVQADFELPTDNVVYLPKLKTSWLLISTNRVLVKLIWLVSIR